LPRTLSLRSHDPIIDGAEELGTLIPHLNVQPPPSLVAPYKRGESTTPGSAVTDAQLMKLAESYRCFIHQRDDPFAIHECVSIGTIYHGID
jgi:hypothetical protein